MARENEFFHISFEMMLKGNVVRRKSGDVRQFGVTVGGSTCLVTSGDTVDRETYDALLKAGAILPVDGVIPQEPTQKASFADADTPVEGAAPSAGLEVEPPKETPGG